MSTRSEPRSTPTILDVARAAGVSKSTVSRVLTGAPDVSVEVRGRVMTQVDRLGYRVNNAARNLRTSRSALVGLLVPSLNHPLFGKIAEDLDRSLKEQGATLAITTSAWDADSDRQALEVLQSRGVDALVLALARDRGPGVAQYLRDIRPPVIMLDRDVRGVRCDSVLTDNRPGTDEAIAHLAELGHRRIGIIRTPSDIRPGREISAAYRRSLAAHGLDADPVLECELDTTTVQGTAVPPLVDSLLDAGATAIISTGPTAVVAPVVSRIEEHGLKMPRDVSFIAFDESELANVLHPRLTSITRPVEEIARLASQLAANRLRSPEGPARVELVPTRLAVRESTGPVPLPGTGKRNGGRSGTRRR